jgi:HEAT repeat protein
VRCLAWIAPAGGIDLVAPLIHDPSPEVRAETAAAIGRLGDEDAAMLLFELLADESELIQESAMGALARMAPGRVVAAAAAGPRQSRRVVPHRAAEALGAAPAGDGAALLALSATRARRSGAPRSRRWASWTPRAFRSGCARRAGREQPACQAVLSLGKLQDPESAHGLLPLLDDPDPRMRFVALRALGQIRNAEAVPQILPFLSDARKELRFAAVEALGTIRAASAVRPLKASCRDADRNLRRAAAEALGNIGDPQQPPLVVALRISIERGPPRRSALGRIRSAKATAALLARLADEDDTVRRAAAAALGELGDARAAARLVQALSDAGLQATSLEAVRRLGAVALPEIERAYAAAGTEVRRLLVDIGGRLEDARARRPFRPCTDSAVSAPMRRRQTAASAAPYALEMDLKATSPEVQQPRPARFELAPRQHVPSSDRDVGISERVPAAADFITKLDLFDSGRRASLRFRGWSD